MISVVQRVKQASVTIDNKLFPEIKQGLLVLLGVEKTDTEEQAKYLADKISELRIFNDEAGKMNLSLRDIGGEMLVVSQFTLAGDCSKGKRPGFDRAARPEQAIPLYEKFIEFIREKNIPVKTGVFGAMMDVGLVNDGPVTFVISKEY